MGRGDELAGYAHISDYGGGGFRQFSADGQGSAALFREPCGVTVDAAGNLYVADWMNHTIRKVTATGMVTTLAGSAGEKGGADGPGAGPVNGLSSVALDSKGNVFVADQDNHTLRKVSPAGLVTTVAGSAGQEGSADGPGSAARFAHPSGVAVDRADNVYVAENGSHTIRKVSPEGVVTTLAGARGKTAMPMAPAAPRDLRILTA